MTAKSGTNGNNLNAGKEDFVHLKKKKMNLKRANSDMNNCQ